MSHQINGNNFGQNINNPLINGNLNQNDINGNPNNIPAENQNGQQGGGNDFEIIKIPMIKEALAEPKKTAELILKNPEKLSAQIEEKLVPKKSHFSFFEKLITVLTFGIGYFVFSGEHDIDDAALSMKNKREANEIRKGVKNLQAGLKTFPNREDFEQTFIIGGNRVKLRQDSDNKLFATFEEGNNKVTFELPLTAAQLRAQLEDDIISHPSLYGKEAVQNTIDAAEIPLDDDIELDEAPQLDENSRTRTLYIKLISAQTQFANVDFTMMPTETVRNCALAVLENLSDKNKAQEAVKRLLTSFAELNQPGEKQDKINSLMTTELLAKLDKEDKNQLENKVDVKNLDLEKQNQIKEQREINRQEIADAENKTREALQNIHVQVDKTNNLARDLSIYNEIDSLCRKLYSLNTDQKAPGTALAEIMYSEARVLAHLIANRGLLNEIKEPAMSQIKKLIDYCQNNNLKTELLIRNEFKMPDKTLKINFFGFEKEAENPLYKTFLQKMETDFKEIEQSLDNSLQKKTLLFSKQLLSELTAKGKTSINDLKDILEKNSETLKLIYADKACLESLSPSVNALLSEIAKTNPDFKVPLTIPQQHAQKVLDVAELQVVADELNKIVPDENKRQETMMQGVKILSNHAELMFRLRDEEYGESVTKEISSANEKLSNLGSLAQRMSYFLCNRVEEKINTFEELKQVLDKVQNGFDPNKDTANLTPEELKEFKRCSFIFSEMKTLSYTLQAHEFTDKIEEVMQKDIAKGESTITAENLKEIISNNLLMFDRLILCQPGGISYEGEMKNTFSTAVFQFMRGNITGIFRTENKVGSDYLLSMSQEDRLKLYRGLLSNEEGNVVPELKAQFDLAIKRIADSMLKISPQSRDGLEPLYLKKEGLDKQSHLYMDIPHAAHEYYARTSTYSKAAFNEKPVIEKQQKFEKKLEDEKVHNFFADLILNYDGSKYDSIIDNPNAKPGTRIVNTILDHIETFNRLVSDPDAINTLPENVRKALGSALGDLRGHLLLDQLEGVNEPPLGGERLPDVQEIIDQVFDSPLMQQLNIQDPVTQKNYVDLVNHIFNNRMLPLDLIFSLVTELSVSKKIDNAEANKLFSLITADLKKEEFTLKEPFKKVDTPNDETLKEIIKNKLLPLQQVKEIIVAMDSKGYLHEFKPNHYVEMAEKAYGDEKVEIKEPFMLAQPGSFKMGLQQIMLKNKLEELLKNPDDELWEVIGNAEFSLNQEIDNQAQIIGNDIAERFNEALKTEGEEKAPLDPTNKNVTLKQLQDEGNSSFNKTALGQFIGEVMKTYFKDMSAIDRRNMLASMVRYSNSDSSPAQILGAMFKGAGPIMQKILQRLPPDALTDDLKTAFADMKCNLAPIPDRIIQAHLLEIVNSSNGEISKISVVRSLGAASVGQAVLCKFFTKDHPEGVEKVVKFLRPDVQNRAEREKKIFTEAAKKVPGMDATFAGDLKTILEELDLTVEANNVESGQIYSNNSTKVKSMTLSPLVRPTTDVMVLDLAPGVTLDKCIRDANEIVKQHLMPFTHVFTGAGYMEIRKYRGEVTDKFEHQNYKVSLDKYNKLSEQYQFLLKQQQNLMSFTKNWVSEGIFGKGFYHGDLHAGNIMTSPDQLTIIDFGNCTQLTPDQQLHITKMMAAAMYSDSSAFIESLTALLSDTSKARLNEHVDKNDPNSPLVKDRMKAVLSAVLSKGSRKDAGARILVALQEVLKLGVEMPAPIYNFSKCQIALNNAIEEMNKALKDTYNAMRIAAANVIKKDQDPVSILMYNIGADNTRDEKTRLKLINRFCTTAKKEVNGPEYRQYILDLFDKKKSGTEVNDAIMTHLDGHDDLKVMFDQYQQCVNRRTEIETLLKNIPEPGTEADPAKEAENQARREMITRELESVNRSAKDIFDGFFEQFKGVIAQDIDDIAEKARNSAKGAKGYDDFLDCMAEVLSDKRSQAVGNLGTGKLIKYAIPMLIDRFA